MAQRTLAVKYTTDGFNEAIANLRKVGQSFDEALSSSQKAVRDAIAASKKALSSGDTKAYQDAEAARVRAAKQGNQAIQNAYRELRVKQTADIEDLKRQAVSAFNAIKNSGVASAQDIANAQAALKRRLSELDGQLDQTGKHARNLGEGFTVLKGTIAGIASGAILNAIGSVQNAFSGLAQNVIAAGTQAERQRVAFETFLGTAEKANKLLAEVRTFAATTPFQLPEITEAAKQLLAVQVEADKVIPTIKMLGEIAAGADKPLSQLLFTYVQIKNQGKATAEEINQLYNAGLSNADFAKALGIAENKVKELASEGKIGFAEVQKTIESMTASGGRFAGLMDKLGGTSAVKLSNLEDAFGNIYRTIYEGIEPALSGTLDLIVATLTPLGENKTVWQGINEQSKEFKEYLEKNPEIAQELSKQLEQGVKVALDAVSDLAKGILEYLQKNPTAIADAVEQLKFLTSAMGKFVELINLAITGWKEIGLLIENVTGRLGQGSALDLASANQVTKEEIAERFKQLYGFDPFAPGAGLGVKIASFGQRDIADMIGEVTQQLVVEKTGQRRKEGTTGESRTVPKTTQPNQVVARKTGKKLEGGLDEIAFDLVQNGKIIDTVMGGASGISSKQNSSDAARNISRSMTPLPEGTWNIDTNAAQKFLKDYESGAFKNYNRNNIPTGSVGPNFIPLTPNFATRRSEIGIHLENVSLGSAGCIVFTDPSAIAKLSKWAVKQGAKSLLVDLDSSGASDLSSPTKPSSPTASAPKPTSDAGMLRSKFSESQIASLIYTVYGEALKNPTSQADVAAVILNRVFSSKYPDTILDVVKAPQQFEAVFKTSRKDISDPKWVKKQLGDAYDQTLKNIEQNLDASFQFLGRRTEFRSSTHPRTGKYYNPSKGDIRRSASDNYYRGGILAEASVSKKQKELLSSVSSSTFVPSGSDRIDTLQEQLRFEEEQKREARRIIEETRSRSDQRTQQDQQIKRQQLQQQQQQELLKFDVTTSQMGEGGAKEARETIRQQLEKQQAAASERLEIEQTINTLLTERDRKLADQKAGLSVSGKDFTAEINFLESRKKLIDENLALEKQLLENKTSAQLAEKSKELGEQIKGIDQIIGEAKATIADDTPENKEIAAIAEINTQYETYNQTIESAIAQATDLIDLKKALGQSTEAETTILEALRIKQQELNGIKEKAISLTKEELDLQKRQTELSNRAALADLNSQVVQAKAGQLSQYGDRFASDKLLQQDAIAQENIRYSQQQLDLESQYGNNPALLAQFKTQASELNQLKLDGITSEFDTLGNTVKDVTEQGLSTLGSELLDFNQSIGEAFRNTAIQILGMIKQIALQIAVSGIMNSIFGGAGGTTVTQSGGGGWLSTLAGIGAKAAGSYFGGGFAKGGTIGQTWTSWGGSKNWGSFKNPLSDYTPPLLLPVQPPPMPLPIPFLPQIPFLSFFAKGGSIGEAIANEKKYGKKPMLAVVHKGEQVLSTLDGEAQQYRKLAAMLGDSPLSKIKMSFATGGDLLGALPRRPRTDFRSALPQPQTTTYNRNSNVSINTTVNMPPGSTTALTAQQVAARNAEAARRALQRD